MTPAIIINTEPLKIQNKFSEIDIKTIETITLIHVEHF